MPTNFQQIQEKILQSDISLPDQLRLIQAFFHVDDAHLEGVIKLFSEDSSWIGRISENYKAKRTAFAIKDSALWQNILEKEAAQLKELE